MFGFCRLALPAISACKKWPGALGRSQRRTVLSAREMSQTLDGPLPDPPELTKEEIAIIKRNMKSWSEAGDEAEVQETPLPEVPEDIEKELEEIAKDFEKSCTYRNMKVVNKFWNLRTTFVYLWQANFSAHAVAQPNIQSRGFCSRTGHHAVPLTNVVDKISAQDCDELEDEDSEKNSPQVSRNLTNDVTDDSDELAVALAIVEKTLGPPGKTREPMPLFMLANRSIKVKKFVQLGVDLSMIARKRSELQHLLQQNWETDVEPRLRFLVDKGVPTERLGWILSRNPSLLWTDVDDMQVRINYLEAKEFTRDMIVRILSCAPQWLSTPTREIDQRLGYLQQAFKLSGDEVRTVVFKNPRLLVSPPHHWLGVKKNAALMERQFGFNDKERKELLLQKPDIYQRYTRLQQGFDYFHNTVGLSHETLVKHYQLLGYRLLRTKPRHQFLKFLKRDIFDPNQPGYVSPDCLWKASDEDFCTNYAKESLENYHLFLQSL